MIIITNLIKCLPSAGGPEQQRHAGRPRLFLRCQQPVQQPGEHDDHCFNQSLLVWQAGCRESRGKSVHLFCILLSNNSYTASHFHLVFSTVCVCVLQTEYARLEGGRCVYRIHRSPMCEYMINFIHKLKHLPEKYMMNSVLENFTILQVTYTFCWRPVEGIVWRFGNVAARLKGCNGNRRPDEFKSNK